jgi:hypothetical protein
LIYELVLVQVHGLPILLLAPTVAVQATATRALVVTVWHSTFLPASWALLVYHMQQQHKRMSSCTCQHARQAMHATQ